MFQDPAEIPLIWGVVLSDHSAVDLSAGRPADYALCGHRQLPGGTWGTGGYVWYLMHVKHPQDGVDIVSICASLHPGDNMNPWLSMIKHYHHVLTIH